MCEEPFIVRVRLAGPLAVGKAPHAPTLDSVLAALAMRERGRRYPPATGDWLDTAPIPGLAARDGIALGSVLLPDGPVLHDRRQLPRCPELATLDFWAKTSKAAHNCGSGPFLTPIIDVPIVAAEMWSWYGVGDPGVVEETLRGRLQAVGGHRGSGCGEVSGIDVHGTDEIDMRKGITYLGEKGGRLLLRPIPLDAAAAWGVNIDELDPDRFTVAAAPRRSGQPWWDEKNLVPCLVPLL